MERTSSPSRGTPPPTRPVLPPCGTRAVPVSRAQRDDRGHLVDRVGAHHGRRRTPEPTGGVAGRGPRRRRGRSPRGRVRARPAVGRSPGHRGTATVPPMGTVPFTPTVHAPNGLVCSADHLASSAGAGDAAAGRHGRGRGDRGQRGPRRGRSPPVRHGRRPLRPGPRPRTGRRRRSTPPGRAGSGSDPSTLRAEGHEVMPFRGDLRTVTVPGCVDGWCRLHERFGRLGLAEVLAPAIGLAEDGFPAGLLLAFTAPMVAEVPGVDECFRDPVADGQRLRRPGQAEALRAIAADGRDGFYRGAFGEGLLAIGDGLYSEDDLAPFARWVEPLGLTGLGSRALDDAAQLAGVPRAGRRRRPGPDPIAGPRGQRVGPPPGRSVPPGRAGSVRRAQRPGRRLGAGRRGAPGAGPRPPGSRPTLGGPGVGCTGGRHHRGDRDRCRRHRGDAHPVERLGLRRPSGRAEHGDVPAQPRSRLQPRRRSPGRTGTGSPPAAHPQPGAGHPAGRPPPGGGRHDGRRQPAPDRAAAPRPAARRRPGRG